VGLSGMTPRAVLLAFVLQVGITFWVVRSEITGRVFVSSWSLPMPGVLALLVLLLLNRIRRRPWGETELLVVYLAISTTVMLVGYNFVQLLLPAVTTPYYFATAANRWSRMHPFLPAWLAPRDPEVIRGLFRGDAPVPWAAWIGPLAAWGLLIVALCVATMSLNLLLARQWIQRERISFPVATLPLEMISPRAPLFRSRLLWLGFALAAVGQSLCALNYYRPAVPSIPLTIVPLNDQLVSAPWIALQPLVVGSTPFYTGLAFLAPTDVQFSIWFFYWLAKAQRLIAFNLGYLEASNLSGRGEPYLNEQSIGGFLAMGLYLLLRAFSQTAERRRQPKGVPAFRRSGVPAGMGRLAHRGGLSGRPSPQASDEEGGLVPPVLSDATPEHPDAAPTPPTGRGPAIVFVVAVAGMILFLVAAGMAPWLAMGMVALYFLMVVAITRVRAEAGFPWAYGPDRSAVSLTHIMGNLIGTRSFPPSQLAALAFFHWFWWDLRFSPMPAQFEALKIGDSAGIRRRQLVAWIAAATIIALLVGSYAALRDSYRFGWATAKVYIGVANGAKSGYNVVNQWWDNPTGADMARHAWTALGGSVTLLLIALRQRLDWWPFHPIGYVIAATPTGYVFWSNYLVAWIVKVCLLRYGGMRLYRTAVPFFVGLTLGDIVTQTTWSLVTSILDLPVYQFL
jgi:hypothetical protein